MTKKDYKIIAEAIKNSTDIGKPNLMHKDQLIYDLIPKLKRDNENFDGFKFIEACGFANQA